MSGIDLGLAGKTALVCGSSEGLGFACAASLAQAGANVILNGRNEAKLVAAAERIRQNSGLSPQFVIADVTTREGRQQALDLCPQPDILVNNAAGPPIGDFRSFDEDSWAEATRISMVAPIMLIKAVVDPMIEKGWGRIINITSTSVKAPLPLLGLSNGARSGLTGFVAGLAREIAVHGVTINNLLPGRIETARLRTYIAGLAQGRGVAPEQVAAELVASNPMKRFGIPEELGSFCAFLCSRQAAYVTGQNILIDGGEYPGL